MAGRGGRRGRGGARGGRGRTRSTPDAQMRSPNSDGEPGAKKSKDAAGEEMSDLMAQPVEILVKILNYLDPKSLRELAFSCQSLFRFCQHAKGIDIVFAVDSVDVKEGEHDVINYVYNFRDRRSFAEDLLKLRKWPFAIHVNNMDLTLLFSWERVDVEIKEFLIRNGVNHIRQVTHVPPMTLEEVNKAAEFMKAFNVGCLMIPDPVDDRMPEIVFKANLQMPVAELEMHQIDHQFDFDSVLKCTIPSVYLGASIDMSQFEALMKTWLTRTDIQSWTFSYHPNFQTMAYFSNWDIRSFTYAGPIDPSRPTVFLDLNTDGACLYIRREDGRLLRVVHKSHFSCVGFNMCPIAGGPLALRGL